MVTVITQIALKDGAQDEWDAAMSERMSAVQRQAGWIGGQLLKPVEGPAARVIVGTWESRGDWEAWHEDEAFRETRERLDGLQSEPAQTMWYEAIVDRRGA